MSLETWINQGRKVSVGGKELVMMPLPVVRLFRVLNWLENNANEVVRDTFRDAEPGKIPSPMSLVTRVFGKVDMTQLVFDILSIPKDPDTGESINKGLTKEFIEDYLDIPTAHKLVQVFVEINDVPGIIKNLQSLPVIKKLTEAASLTFGIPYLNSLHQSTVSTPSASEGSHSHKSMDTSEHVSTEGQDLGKTIQEKPTLLQ